MARVKANLGDENHNIVLSVEVESDVQYHVNDYFSTHDGGLYLVAEVKPGESPINTELDAMWIDGPHPSTLVVTGEGFGVGFRPNATPAEQEQIARRALRWNAEREGDPVDETEIEAKARWLVKRMARLEEFKRGQQAKRQSQDET